MNIPREPRNARYGTPSIATEAARGARTRTSVSGVSPSPSEPLDAGAALSIPSLSFPSIAAAEQLFASATEPPAAGRAGPERLADALAGLERADAAVVTCSGASALLAALLACTTQGDRVLATRDVAGSLRTLLEQDAERLGLSIEYVDGHEPAKVADGLARGARFVLVESLSSALLREPDLAALSWHARSWGALLCVDNTLATPAFRRPLEQGADLVLHASAELLGGQHDLRLGALAGRAAPLARVRAAAARLGVVASAFDGWQVERGLRTLSVRTAHAQASARALAPWLAQQPLVQRVHYPGWGVLLSFDVGDRATAERVVTRSAQIRLTTGVGGTASSLTHPASGSHRELAHAERAQLGVRDGLLRLSLGLEEARDLMDELSRALAP